MARAARDERFDDRARFLGRRRSGCRRGGTSGEEGDKTQASRGICFAYSGADATTFVHSSGRPRPRLSPARTEAVPPARVSTGALPRNVDALRLAEDGANLAPLLKPEVFRRLSSAGQRAVLRAAGLLPAPAGARPPHPPLARTLPALTPAPGQNVRVNDPSTDVDGHTNSETSIAARGSSVMVGFNDANPSWSPDTAFPPTAAARSGTRVSR